MMTAEQLEKIRKDDEAAGRVGAVHCPVCKRPKRVVIVFQTPRWEFYVCAGCYLADHKAPAEEPGASP